MLGGVDGGGGFLSEVFRGKGPFWERLARASADAARRRDAGRAAREERTPSRDLLIQRSRLAVAVEARLAVRSGVRLDDFLRGRLARYAARLPVPLEALPAVVDVEGGEPIVRARPPVRTAKPAGTGTAEAWLDALVAREGPHAAQEIQDAGAAVSALEARTRTSRERVDALARKLADDLAAGAVPSPPRIEATPEQLGRPAVPSPAPAGILQGFVLALLAAEGWRFSEPALAAAGFEPVGAVAALKAAPLPAAMGLVFALGAAVAVFAFASFSLSRARAAIAEAEAPRRRAVFAAGATGAAALAAGGAAAAASDASWAHVTLLAAVPFGAALVLDLASRLAKTRACALDAALAWDRERAREYAERARRVEVVERAQAELARSADDLEAARRRLRALERRAVDAARAAERRAAAEARRLERLAESLAGALELDRYAFVRLAADRAHDVLVRPVRSGPRLEPAVSERIGVAG